MEIVKFNSFINEAIQIRVLDVVIDSNGNVYNGVFNPLIKGNVDMKPIKLEGEKNEKNRIVGILGNDKNNYIAGIDKNGYLVAPYTNISSDGYLIDDNGKIIKIPDNIKSILKTKDSGWKFGVDYTKLLSSDSTGWVNFKVDMEIFKRVKRYSSGLGSYKKGHKSFISKLEDLNSINFIKHRKRSIKTVQREMSVIMLLHYIDEIKSFFTPSAAGFLFESFIGGLLPNAKIVSDNGNADILSDGREYQIKTLEAHSSSVEFIMKTTETGLKYLDHYIICFKYPGKIEIYVFDGDENSDSYCGRIIDRRGVLLDDKPGKLSGSKVSRSCTFLNIIDSSINPYVIDLLDIDNNIDRISKGLKGTLNNLFEELSKFQYNVETIVAGVNKEGKLIDGNEFELYSNNARQNANSMRNELENLISHYKREPKI